MAYNAVPRPDGPGTARVEPVQGLRVRVTSPRATGAIFVLL